MAYVDALDYNKGRPARGLSFNTPGLIQGPPRGSLDQFDLDIGGLEFEPITPETFIKPIDFNFLKEGAGGDTLVSSTPDYSLTRDIENPFGLSKTYGTATEKPKAGLDGYKTFSLGVGAFQAAANAYLGLRNLRLSRDQFNLARDSYNRNLANKALAYNTQLERQAAADAAGQGRRYDAASLASYVDPRRVSGAAV